MFAHTRAATVAPASTEALPVSVRRKCRSAVFLCQSVRPENPDAASCAALSADDGSLTARTLSPAPTNFYPERAVALAPAPSFNPTGNQRGSGTALRRVGTIHDDRPTGGGGGWP